MTAHSSIVLFFTIIAVCIQELGMATSPVTVDPTETKDETAKDNTENQGNVQVLWQILWQSFNLITELLFLI